MFEDIFLCPWLNYIRQAILYFALLCVFLVGRYMPRSPVHTSIYTYIKDVNGLRTTSASIVR
jgi:hypothetical protein